MLGFVCVLCISVHWEGEEGSEDCLCKSYVCPISKNGGKNANYSGPCKSYSDTRGKIS